MKRLLVVLLTLVLISACSSTPSSGSSGPSFEAAYPTFSSTSQLASAADAIVRGRVTGIAGRYTDTGGSGKSEAGIPMVVYSFTVTGKGNATSVADSLLIARIDSQAAPASIERALESDREYVLFLREYVTGSVPDAAKFGTLYVPLGANAGIFSVEGGVATALDQGVAVTDVGSTPATGSRKNVNADALLILPAGHPGRGASKK